MLDANVLDVIRQFSKDAGESLQREESLRELYDVNVVTPMFGGGVENGVNDANKLVRETEIRGALRFWWRATKGAECADHKRLFEEESRLWGTTDNPSGVNVRVGLVNEEEKKKPVKCSEYCKGKQNPLGYVLFPFAGNERAKLPERSGLDEFSFKLALEYRSRNDRDQFDMALKAWANFGGIGARTRRGCGALFCNDLAFEGMEELRSWLRELNLGNKRTNQDWSIIDSVLLREEVKGKDLWERSKAAWKEIIKLYRDFRQTGSLARNQKTDNSSGRSNWIEPDSIRSITKRYPQIHKPCNEENAFPRIEFGAPIIFHFKDKGSEPDDQTVKPIYERKPQERMASPVLLRPIVFKDETVYPCAVFFRTPLPKEVVLEKREKQGVYKVATKFANSYGNPNPSLKEYLKRSDGSALKAFKLYLKDNGFKQIYGGSDR